MSILESLKSRIKKSGSDNFFKGVITLVGGTVFSQIIAILALPILTRLYGPGDFKVLAAYSAILILITSIACLRFEIAIAIPEKDSDAANIVFLSLLSSAFFTIIVFFAVLFFGDDIFQRIGGEEGNSNYLFLLPVGVLGGSLYAIFQYWNIRKKNFKVVAKTRVFQSVSSTIVQLSLGITGWGVLGLLIGYTVNSCAGAFSLMRSAWKNNKKLLKTISFVSVKDNFKRYVDFPRYSVVEVLANNLGTQAVMLIMASILIGDEAGYLFLAMKIMALPMSLISGAVAQVYLSRAPEEYKNNNLGPFTEAALLKLSKIGVGPLIAMGITAPVFFPLVFGGDWIRSGILAEWMIPWVVLQFLASPISMSMHVCGHQKRMLALTMIGGGLRLGTVFAVNSSYGMWVAEAYILSSALFYFFCYVIFSNCSGLSVRSMFLIFFKNLHFYLLWALIGILIKFIAIYFL